MIRVEASELRANKVFRDWRGRRCVGVYRSKVDRAAV